MTEYRYFLVNADEYAGLPSRQQVWDVIATVRDASPRAVDDASTDDIVDALIDSGLLKVSGGSD